MSSGSFYDFRSALLAFESGWDRDRYDAGQITDAQLTQWVGGPVSDFYDGYSSWGQLSVSEWEAMAYRSMNSYGKLFLDLTEFIDLAIENGVSGNPPIERHGVWAN